MNSKWFRWVPVLSAVVAMGLLPSSGRGAEWTLAQMVGKDAQGQPIYVGKPLDAKFKNPISPEDEAAFQARARNVISAQGKLKVAAGNTYFENEKRTYGYLMAQVLAGDPNAAKNLQLEDAQANEWHRETAGIDFFACFTIKHQTRKYFYFGDLLDPKYRERMKTGAKAWTEKDPMQRPHPVFKGPGGGWGPDQKNSWVDVRTTENLYLMRVSSVYLFAEETGNKEVTEQYKREIARYAATMYRVGMGEWDSENYHGHSIGPLCNLFDFAKDDEVRLLAKACLDWVFAAGAVKYYRGGFNGPTKRDYNHVQPFGGSAANMLSLHFGDCPTKQGEWESDEVHLITSSYRPPPAVLKLARKQLPLPVELYNSKPSYSATTSGQAKSLPEYLETYYLGHSFQMGSLASGTSEDGGDVNGFKIIAYSQERGADALQCVPGSDPLSPGSPKYQSGKVSAANRVAQDRNVAIWLVRSGKSPWRWVIPQAIRVSQEKEVTFLEGERTWVAIRGVGTSSITPDEAGTKLITEGEKPAFPGHKVLAATGNAETYCGLVVEVGEKETHGSLDKFKQQVLAAELDAGKLNEGVVQYKTKDGKFLGIHWSDKASELGVWKNGKRHDWLQHAAYLYRNAQATELAAPIYSRWHEGKLYVEAGDQAFASRVSEDGQVMFANGSVQEVRAKFGANP